MEKTAHGRIFKAKPEPLDSDEFNEKIAELQTLSELGSAGVVQCIEEILPNFHHAENEGSNVA